MTVIDVVVVVAAVLAVAGLGWFFFGPRRAQMAEVAGGVQRVRIRVAGGYSPDVIHVRQGVPLELVFDRQESGECTSRVVFPDLRNGFDQSCRQVLHQQLSASVRRYRLHVH